MPTINDFRVGDGIVNSYYCRGRVISIKDGVMQARYTDRGGSWNETYDAEWFAKYGGLIQRFSFGQPDK